jgi:hypothetical protein
MVLRQGTACSCTRATMYVMAVHMLSVPCVTLLTLRDNVQILYLIVWLAAVGAGGCISGSNPANTIYELKHLLKITNTKFIIS